MKKILLLLTVLVCVSSHKLIGQDNRLRLQTEFFVEYVNLFKSSSEYEDDYKGTPYGNPDFQLGNIYTNGKTFAKNIAVRYNAVADEIEIKPKVDDDDSKTKALMKTSGVSVEINDKIYTFVDGKGYLEVLFSGNEYTLFKKLGKKYIPPKPAKNSFERDFPAEFKDIISYFLFKKGSNSLIELPSSKKKRLKAFGADENVVKNIMKEKKLNLSKEEDLITTVKLLDTK